MRRTSRWLVLAVLVLAAAGGAAWHWRQHILDLGRTAVHKPPLARATLAERLRQLTPEATVRLRPAFDAAGVPFPAAAVRLVALKKAEKRLTKKPLKTSLISDDLIYGRLAH